jgi:Tol biopolymer transport system component
VSANGGTPRQLLPDAQDRVDVNWSPSGNSLVFGSFNVPNTPISILDVKTKQLSNIPGSVGLFSPRWSPDGRYICAITVERPFKLMLFDLATKKWTQLVDTDIGYPNWSHDGRYIYFEVNPHQDQPARIDRIRISDRKIETVVRLQNVGRAVTGSFVEWSGLAPDDSPLLSRDISTHEIYALQLNSQ